MSDHTKIHLSDLDDSAPQFGMGEICEARFARGALGAERIGMAHYRMKAGRRLGFGHSHGEVEEMYVVLAGDGRFRIGDEIVPVAAHDVVYVPPGVMREWEAGPDGMEMIAFGGHADDAEMARGWWTDA